MTETPSPDTADTANPDTDTTTDATDAGVTDPGPTTTNTAEPGTRDHLDQSAAALLTTANRPNGSRADLAEQTRAYVDEVGDYLEKLEDMLDAATDDDGNLITAGRHEATDDDPDATPTDTASLPADDETGTAQPADVDPDDTVRLSDGTAVAL